MNVSPWPLGNCDGHFPLLSDILETKDCSNEASDAPVAPSLYFQTRLLNAYSYISLQYVKHVGTGIKQCSRTGITEMPGSVPFKMFHMLFLLCSTISILDFDVIYLGVSFFYCLHEFASQYKLTGLQFKAW